MNSSSDSFSWYTSTAQSGPSGPLLLMQHSHPTLAFKTLIVFPPAMYLLPLHPHHPLKLLAVSLFLLLLFPFPDSLRIPQWNAGGLRARSTELLHFLSSHCVDLICIQESGSGIFCIDVTDDSGGVIIFVRQGLSFSELSTYSLSSLVPYPNYVEINISLNNSFSLSFLRFMLPLFALLRRIAKPISFLPPLFPPPQISLFLETSIAITPTRTQKVLPTPVGRKHSIGLSPLPSSSSMTLTYLLFSIASLAVAPPLKPYCSFLSRLILLLGGASELGF